MPDGYALVVLLMAAGIVFLVAEVFLPSHGILGLGAACCILGAIFATMRHNPAAGLVLLLICIALTPIAWTAFVKIWPKTPVGRRVVLPPVTTPESQPLVTVGQTGTAMSELRPGGVCDFAGVRVEAHSEHGIVQPGSTVKVVALVNNRPTVRVLS
jgi:membrane-bound ClpP family serine protease